MPKKVKDIGRQDAESDFVDLRDLVAEWVTGRHKRDDSRGFVFEWSEGKSGKRNQRRVYRSPAMRERDLLKLAQIAKAPRVALYRSVFDPSSASIVENFLVRYPEEAPCFWLWLRREMRSRRGTQIEAARRGILNFQMENGDGPFEVKSVAGYIEQNGRSAPSEETFYQAIRRIRNNRKKGSAEIKVRRIAKRSE